MQNIQIFQGHEGRNLADAISGMRIAEAYPAAWFWQPTDYDGDVAYAGPFVLRKEAEADARDICAEFLEQVG